MLGFHCGDVCCLGVYGAKKPATPPPLLKLNGTQVLPDTKKLSVIFLAGVPAQALSCFSKLTQRYALSVGPLLLVGEIERFNSLVVGNQQGCLFFPKNWYLL